MERDWNIIRNVLLRLEEKGPEQHTLRAADFDNDPAVAYNVELLEEAGLIDARMSKQIKGPVDFFVLRLTWDGHEFLDAIRSETVWARVRKTFTSNGLSMTFDLVKALALKYATELILPSS